MYVSVAFKNAQCTVINTNTGRSLGNFGRDPGDWPSNFNSARNSHTLSFFAKTSTPVRKRIL